MVSKTINLVILIFFHLRLFVSILCAVNQVFHGRKYDTVLVKIGKEAQMFIARFVQKWIRVYRFSLQMGEKRP